MCIVQVDYCKKVLPFLLDSVVIIINIVMLFRLEMSPMLNYIMMKMENQEDVA